MYFQNQQWALVGRLAARSLGGVIAGLAAWAVGELVLLILPFNASSSDASPANTASQSAPADGEPALVASLDAAAAPPSPFRERLVARGGHYGDVQISLVWDNDNDLDLCCIGPDGAEISPASRSSTSGGRMDVEWSTYDRGSPQVENIYWPAGTPKVGHYRIYVSVYERAEAGPDETPFRVSVLADGHRQEYPGTIRYSARAGKQIVHEFEVKKPPTVAPAAGTSAEPIAGAEPATPGKEDAVPAQGFSWPAAFRWGMWEAVPCPFLLLGLLLVSNHWVGKRPLLPRDRSLALAFAGGFVGFVCGSLGRALDLVFGFRSAGVGFVLGWIAIGAILGLLARFTMAGLRPKPAAIAGAVVGLIAAIAFLLGPVAELPGRLYGLAILGLATGLGMELAELRSRGRAADPRGPASLPPLTAVPPINPPPPMPRPPAGPSVVVPPPRPPQPPVPPAPPRPAQPAASKPGPLASKPGTLKPASPSTLGGAPTPPKPATMPPTPAKASIAPGNSAEIAQFCPTCNKTKLKGRPGTRFCAICGSEY